MAEAVVAGHLVLDISPEFLGDKRSLSDIFVPGKLIDMGAMRVSTGGVVSNTGLSMHMLGADVLLMGKVGDDMFGEGVKAFIDSHGAKRSLIPAPNEETSYTVVLTPPGVDRIFLHCPGCNATFITEDVDWESVRKARLFHFGYPPLMKSMYENGGAELFKLLKTAKDAGVKVSLDMALPDPQSPAGKADWRKILSRCLPLVDVFLPSLEETLFMLNPKLYEQLLQTPNGAMGISEADAQAISEEIIGMGAAISVMKMGTRGIRVCTAEKYIVQPSFRAPRVASTSGAGDACIAGFLTGLLRGFSLEETARLGCAAGCLNVQSPASVGGITSLEDTLLQMKNWDTHPTE